MIFRALALAMAAGLAGMAWAQTGTAVPNGATSAASAATAAQTDDKPQVTPEMRGDIFMATKHYREAIEAFNQGSPKNPVLWNKKGIAYHQMTQLDSALKDYQQAVKLNRNYLEAINNIGTVYYARKSFSRSISYYRRAIKIAPHEMRTASVYNNLGTAYFARKQYKNAAAAFEEALTLDPDVFEHRSNYGVMLEERNVEERAKYHYYVAKLYAKTGRNELALQYLRKALEEGLKDRKQLEKDPEFATLRNTKEFKDLLASEPRVL